MYARRDFYAIAICVEVKQSFEGSNVQMRRNNTEKLKKMNIMPVLVVLFLIMILVGIAILRIYEGIGYR